ncbi:MAG: hypothetical protein GY789_19550 [Hyphomicrobiales bacterium]|nr:hypothetical protein [Hyphomicrobiales bacterium]MCP5076409.1 hypothetical protein [Paracoccaceae bacterium]
MEKRRISAAAAVLAALVVVPTAVWAQQSDFHGYGYGPHMMGWGGGWYGMILGPIFMILVLVAVIAAVILLVRWLGGPLQSGAHSHDAPRGQKPLEILKLRFARGEIDKDEYEERRRVLGD